MGHRMTSIDEDAAWHIRWEKEKAESRALLANFKPGDRVMLNDRAWAELHRASKLMIGRRGGTVMKQRKNSDSSYDGRMKILWDGTKNPDLWGTSARDVMFFDENRVRTKAQCRPPGRLPAKHRDWWMWA
jgi:hypothetical protein